MAARMRKDSQRRSINRQCLHCESLEERVVLATTMLLADGFTSDDTNPPDGVAEIVASGLTGMQTRLFSNNEQRSELEFDVSLDASETILSAHLEVTAFVAVPMTLKIYGYAGDGVISLGDHGDTMTLPQMGMESLPVSNGVVMEFDLSASVVADIVGPSGGTLGILITTTTLGSTMSIDAEESGNPAVLVIETDEDAIDSIDAIVTTVDGLVDDDLLTQGNGNSLTAKLEGAGRKIGDGNNLAAINKLEAFINQVAALEKRRQVVNSRSC